VLTLADHRTIGIEHRDIATERYQRFLSKTSKFRNTEECLDDDNYLKALKEADLPSVTYGDADDYEWANLALSAISDKIDLLNRGHFESLDSFELILYSNTHLQNILNKYRAIASLANKLNKELIGRFHSRLYDSISIIYGDEVWLRDLKLLKQARIGKEGNKEIDLGFETPRQCYLPSNQHQALNELRGILSDEFAVQALVLYGSVARGEADEESDLDLLVVTDQPLTRVARHQKITDMVFEINLRYSTNISTLVVDRNSWEVGVVSVLPLKDEILKDGICL
jgi:predicted nucleotidyltransferase